MKIYLSRIFPFVHVNLSVDSVVASFQRQAAKLRALVEHHDDQATQHRLAADQLHAAAGKHEDEAFRADTIATNIERLLGVA